MNIRLTTTKELNDAFCDVYYTEGCLECPIKCLCGRYNINNADGMFKMLKDIVEKYYDSEDYIDED